MCTKRKRGQFTSSTYSRHRQTPNHLKRVMPTPYSVNSSLVLDGFLNLAILEYKNLKVDIHPICPFQLFHSLPIGIPVL